MGRRSDSTLARVLRKDLMGKRASRPFPSTDFSRTAEICGSYGYFALSAIRDMEDRERDMFSQQSKRDYCGRNCLADLRSALKIFDWFEPHGRIRGATNTNFAGNDIDSRAKSRAADFSNLTNGLAPDHDVANSFSVELERGSIFLHIHRMWRRIRCRPRPGFMRAKRTIGRFRNGKRTN